MTMVSQVRRYGFINAKLRARIADLLSEELIQRMAAASSLSETFGLLRDTPYAVVEQAYQSSGDLKVGELELFRGEVGLFREMERYTEDEVHDMVQSLSLRYEIDNLKNGLRTFFLNLTGGGQPDSRIPHLYDQIIIHEIDVPAAARAKNIEQVVDLLEGTPYHEIVKSHAQSVVSEKTLFPLEVALDHYYYRQLLESARRLKGRDRKIAFRLAGVEIDLHNIDWMIRFRQFHRLSLERVLALAIPGGLTMGREQIEKAFSRQDVTAVLRDIIAKRYPDLGSLLSARPADTHSRLLLIEEILRHILMHEVRRILSGYPFTIGIILAYFILKRDEIRRVRSLLIAKQYGLPREQIRNL
jgi:V/A-type H+-transporting ATPase subunit C